MGNMDIKKDKKKGTISGKQVKLIINFISLGIFIFSYFYLYESYVEKTDNSYLEVEQTKVAIQERERMLKEEDSVRERIAEVNEKKQKIIDSFPVYIGNEDNFLFVEQMEKKLKVKTSSVIPSDNTEFFRTILPAKEKADGAGQGAAEAGNQGTSGNAVAQDKSKAGTDQQAVMTATVSSLSMSFVTDYQGFKDMMDYIGNYPDHTIVDSVSVSADNISGILAGNLVLKRFALTGTGKEYQEPSFDKIDIGTDNIFGAGKNKENAAADPEAE